MFLGEEKSSSELSFAEHLGAVRGYEFLTTQEGDVSVELGARLGLSPRCPLQFRPARARWGTPVSAKFQNANRIVYGSNLASAEVSGATLAHLAD